MNTFFDDVKEFTKKFKLEIVSKPNFCNNDLLTARLRHLDEEVAEIKNAVYSKDLAGFLDGLVDLVYVALGTAANANLPFNEAWELIHKANMLKMRATNITKRGTKQDVVKPIGWKHPDIEELLSAEIQKPRGIIIIEGPDHCGKTTLCNYLIDKYQAKYIHATFPYDGTNDVFKYHLKLLESAIAMSRDNIVLIDRLWPSEVIYGSVYRNGNSKPGYEILLDRLIRQHGGIYVFCLFSTKRTAIKMYKKILDLSNVSHKRDIYSEKGTEILCNYKKLFYDMCYEDEREDVYHYHYYDEGNIVDVISEQIIYMLSEQVNKKWSPSLSMNNVLGSVTDARYLLVGDQYSKKHEDARPFFDLNNCSKYFLEQLSRLNISDRHFAFTNINEDGGDRVVDFCHTVRKMPIIAMGDAAFNSIKKLLNISPYKINHPQWYRRFDYHGTKLIDDLKKLIKEISCL